MSSKNIKNVILIGFMASGKSRVGRELARKLKFKFIDTDNLVEKKQKIRIKEIFARFGEKHFRKLETETLKAIKNFTKYVIATGGGIILKKINVGYLRKMGPVVYLKVSPEVVLKRVGTDRARPLLNTRERLKRIREILRPRQEKYETAADFMVNTDKLTTAEIAAEISGFLKKYEKK